jgi:hypothetical protein
LKIEIKVKLEDLQKKSLFLGLPCYGGNCAAIYSRSLSELSALCMKYQIPLRHYYLLNESLITRARSYCADEFMRSDATHMMFIDSDIGFDAIDVIAMLALMTDESPYDVMGGPYPKKNISWEKVVTAVNKGFGDKNPNDLEKYVGDYVFNPRDGKPIQISEPASVLELGTGFMMIRRKTFEKFEQSYPEKSYKPDHIRSAHFDGTREIMAYFDCSIDPITKRYLSEDYDFCQKVIKMGMNIWLCPWMKLQHMGTHIYGGSLADLATLGVTSTADPDKIGKR